jgi:maltose/moltooligosaccharide transporter
LVWVQFFSWFALFPWIYTVPAVTQHIYGTTDINSEACNTGANQGEMFANYNLIAATFLLPLLAKYTSRKFHTLSSHLLAEDLVLCLSIS